MPRGANLHTPEQRAADDAKIRSRRHRYSIEPEQPQPELELGTAESPIELERQRASLAMQAVRKQLWQRPTFSPDGRLVARELEDEFFLAHEDVSEVIEREAPSYDGWTIVLTPLGMALVEPGKIPSLIEDAEIPDGLDFLPAGNGTFRLVEPLSVD